MRLETPRAIQLGGRPGLLTKLTTRTSNQQEPDQTVYLYTVVRGDLLFSLAAGAPPSRWSEAESVFQQMTRTVLFKD